MQDENLSEQMNLVERPIEEIDGFALPTPVSPKSIVRNLLPTPTVVHMTRNDEDDVEAYLERRRKAKEKVRSPRAAWRSSCKR